MKKGILLIILALITVLAACSSGSDNSESEGTSEENNSETKETSDGNGITVEDAYGEKTIDETPKRIVVLEWTYGEDLLALGVQPVGMADIEGYKNWVNIGKELSGDVKDVGTRQEPNLEAISKLNPDLIITASFRHDAIMENLNKIAPTLAFNPYPEEGEGDQYEEMTSTFNKIAKVVGKEGKAEEVLTSLDETYTQAQEKINNASVEDKSFILTQAFSSNNTPTLRLFTDNGMATQIMEKIGLENAFESDGFELYGYKQTTVETLQNFQDAHFFYIVQNEDNIFENQLKGNPVWESLKFVENGKTHKLPPETWVFGGPLSAKVFAEQVTEALLQEK